MVFYVTYPSIVHLVSVLYLHYLFFISINSDSSSNEILDSTRIHPETYAWATKMAEDAVEYDDEVRQARTYRVYIKYASPLHVPYMTV